jgi:hypothetical protein
MSIINMRIFALQGIFQEYDSCLNRSVPGVYLVKCITDFIILKYLEINVNIKSITYRVEKTEI